MKRANGFQYQHCEPELKQTTSYLNLGLIHETYQQAETHYRLRYPGWHVIMRYKRFGCNLNATRHYTCLMINPLGLYKIHLALITFLPSLMRNGGSMVVDLKLFGFSVRQELKALSSVVCPNL